MRQHGLRQEHHAPAVEVDLFIPLIERHFNERPHDRNTSIVDENIDLAAIEASDGLVDKLLRSFERR